MGRNFHTYRPRVKKERTGSCLCNGSGVFKPHLTKRRESPALFQDVVLASTNEGDLILDPFTGSSTTGLAAAMFERKFIGIDLEKEYLDLSVKRLEKLNRQKKLTGWE
ncbi:MAG: site-specific DNA-methyltransferase [Thermoplasmata archaeon]|nr:site-specific DNA-methyltransferase [Thermoplasmata archaeon]